MADTAATESVEQRFARIEAELGDTRHMLAEVLASLDHRPSGLDVSAALPPVSLKQATAMATELAGRSISPSTMRRMCISEKIGWQLPGGTWLVSQEGLRRCILGKTGAQSETT
jgi:hypothetical protein